MSVAVSSKRYAQAIFRIAKEREQFEQWQTSLDQISRIMQNKQFVEVLENPKLTFSQKANFLRELLGGVNPLILNLMYLLVLKNKFKNIPEIARYYATLLDEFRGIKRSVITTSMPLEGEERDKLNQFLEEIIGHKLKSEFEVNPDVIGGFIARIDGTLIDGSIRSKLIKLKDSIRSEEDKTRRG